MQYGVPISSWRRYRRPIALASSKSVFHRLRRTAARSRAFGDRSALRDSGSTATFTGASLRSSRSTVRFSSLPLASGASYAVDAENEEHSAAVAAAAPLSHTRGIPLPRLLVQVRHVLLGRLLVGL